MAIVGARATRVKRVAGMANFMLKSCEEKEEVTVSQNLIMLDREKGKNYIRPAGKS
jgi:hypothetical protein